MRRIERVLRRIAAHGAMVAVAGALGVCAASAEPPIRSPEDAACRAEAKARVFSAPNPRGLELEEIGRGIYYACMDRIAGHGKSRRKHHRRHHRHR